MKKLLAILFVLVFVLPVFAQVDQEVIDQFQGMVPEQTFTDDDGIQRFVVTCPDSFYSVWWIWPDSIGYEDSATVFSPIGPVTDYNITIRAAIDTFNVNDQKIGEWFGTTNYHVGFVAFKWIPVDWDVNERIWGSPRLFRVEVNRPLPPDSVAVNFLADPSSQ